MTLRTSGPIRPRAGNDVPCLRLRPVRPASIARCMLLSRVVLQGSRPRGNDLEASQVRVASSVSGQSTGNKEDAD